MRWLLALTVAASAAACSHNHANVRTGPETGRVETDTVRTTGTASGEASGTATGTATGTVDTSGTATDSATISHDSM